MKAFRQLIISNFKEITRDTMQLVCFIVFPIMFALLFGLVFSKTSSNSIGEIRVVSKGESTIYKQMIDDFKSIEGMKVIVEEDESKAIEEFKSKSQPILLVFPEKLDEKIKNGESADIKIFSNPSALKELYIAKEVINQLNKNLIGKKEPLEVTIHSKQDNNQLNGIFPGILAMTIMQLGLFGSIRIVSLKEKKALKTISVTSLSKKMFIASEVVVRTIIAFVQAAIILAIGYSMFNLKISGNWLSISAWILIGALAFVAFGYAIVSICRTVNAANGVIQIFQLIMMFLSGIFIPQNLMPNFMQPVIRALPLTYLVDGMKYSIAGVPNEYPILLDIAVILIVTLVGFIISVKLKWDE